VQVAPPDCHKTIFRYRLEDQPSGSSSQLGSVDAPDPTNKTDAYFFRIRVANIGNQKAEDVEVIATQLSRRLADGTFKPVDSFLPMNLVWSFTSSAIYPAVSPGIYKNCDLFHIVNPTDRKKIPPEDQTWENVKREEAILSFNTIVKPYTKNYLVCSGAYQLILTVGASNAKPIRKTLEIVVIGKWFDDEKKMLGEGVGIKLL
jgi:hypothetical protein